MIISRRAGHDTKSIITFGQTDSDMAEEVFMFGVTIGMFVVLVGIIFGARGRRYSRGFTPGTVAGHGE
jgi:hypothetical protein